MFDLVVVGEGGGPDETNLSAYVVFLDALSQDSTRPTWQLTSIFWCSYLFKPSGLSWEDGTVALEAGTATLHSFNNTF